MDGSLQAREGGLHFEAMDKKFRPIVYQDGEAAWSGDIPSAADEAIRERRYHRSLPLPEYANCSQMRPEVAA
ncbi:hypothetical protein IV102_09225 [bacterium]|nr:hypothetical protein [bacterium]